MIANKVSDSHKYILLISLKQETSAKTFAMFLVYWLCFRHLSVPGVPPYSRDLSLWVVR